MKIHSLWDLDPSKHEAHEEELDPTSFSVPDMSFSVKEILSRFRRGTLQPADLYRVSNDFEIDLDDDRFDGIDDFTDVDRVKRNTEYEFNKVADSIRFDTSGNAPDSGNAGTSDGDSE